MRGCKSESIKSNLDSLRTEHLVRGFDFPSLRPVVVKKLLQGNKDLKSLADTVLGRATVDMDGLKIMRSNLHGFGMSQHDTVLLWFSMLCMFYGSFRVHEIVPRKKSEYDPSRTQLRKDLVLRPVYVSGAPV